MPVITTEKSLSHQASQGNVDNRLKERYFLVIFLG